MTKAMRPAPTKRSNIDKLAHRVTVLENEMRIQGRVNQYQSEYNKRTQTTRAEIIARLKELESLVVQQQNTGKNRLFNALKNLFKGRNKQGSEQ